MRSPNRKEAVVIVLIALSSILVTIGVFEFLLFGCVDTVKMEVASPDGRYIATVFERNCGATTDYATHVRLRKAKKPFFGTSQTRVIVVVKGRGRVEPAWTSEDRLTIALPKGAATFNKEETWGDVRVDYKLVR